MKYIIKKKKSKGCTENDKKIKHLKQNPVCLSKKKSKPS